MVRLKDSGDIGGFDIDSTTISDTSKNLVLSSSGRKQPFKGLINGESKIADLQ